MSASGETGPLQLPCRRAQSGFSLLEALIAFTVLALILGALFEVFSNGLRTLERDRSYTYAVELTQNLMAELVSQDNLAAGRQRGRVDDRYDWSLDVAPYEAEDGHPAPETLVQVTMRVEWDDGWRTRSVALTTLELAGSP